ncbi:MAG: endonuclease MutS2 [Oscillospiraceae bacterium]|nr:endonuclease MutS2 [Oscillospiraceae bacterium]
MQEKYMHILEFNEVLNSVAEQAVYSESKEQILKLEPSTNFETVKKLLKRTEMAMILCLRYGMPDMLQFDDMDIILKKIEQGGIASLKELINILQMLRTVKNLKRWYIEFIQKEQEKEQEFNREFNNLAELKTLYHTLEDAIISEEELSDNASPNLFNIRRELKQNANAIKEELWQFAKTPETKKYLQEGTVTIKNGRFVLPVKSEHQSKINGLVHEASASGSTLFIEPEAVVSGNNKIRLLEAAEKEEIYKILRELSNKVLKDLEQLKNNWRLILFFDMLFAKAKYAIQINAINPELTEDSKINLRGARHPLLPQGAAVPIDIVMPKETSTLVITGPNTGGKTVTLKTAGLLALMAMSGLLIPAKEGSTVSVFKNILVDIGDEQSIEQNLSTFSGHIKNLVQILKIADSHSLVLVDELGSGTDPVEGAGLAVSILNELKSKGAKTIATTHYSELKMYALNTPNVQNASCEFDIETLKPTYKLILGIPGKSYAFNIAERLGIEQKIIENAKKCIDEGKLRFEDVVNKLNNTQQELQEKIDANETLKKELEIERNKLKVMQAEVMQQKEELIEKFKAETEPIIEFLQKSLKHTATELEEIKKEGNIKRLEELRTKFKTDIHSKLGKISFKNDKQNINNGKTHFKSGDTVLVLSLHKEGVLTSNPDKNGFVNVKLGNISTKISTLDLKLCKTQNLTNKISHFKTTTSRVSRKAATELHLRGLTAEEATAELDKFIDDAIISGLHSIVVVHGKGTGVLKSAVHNYLKSSRVVKSFRLGKYGEGEDGVTIVEL